MKQLSAAALERAMKLQDVILLAMAKRITWDQAAELLGIVAGSCSVGRHALSTKAKKDCLIAAVAFLNRSECHSRQ